MHGVSLIFQINLGHFILCGVLCCSKCMSQRVFKCLIQESVFDWNIFFIFIFQMASMFTERLLKMALMLTSDSHDDVPTSDHDMKILQIQNSMGLELTHSHLFEFYDNNQGLSFWN